MTAGRLAAAAAFAAVVTATLLAGVALLNHADHRPEPPPARAPLPIAAPPKRPEPPPPPEPTTSLSAPTLQAPAPQPLAVVEPSAVSDLPDTHAPTNHISVLPGLEAGDLGPLSVGAVGGSTQADSPARPVRRPQPSYPPSARRRNVEGFVTVRLRVDATGRVIDAVVVKAEPEGVFEEAAVRTARRYRFEPAIVNGEPAADTVEQRIVFRLRR